MATINGSWTPTSLVGTLYFKVKYRLSGETIWTSFNVPTSGTTMSFSGLNNRIYDVQYVNINGDTNPASAIVQGIGFTDPNPLLSPTNVTLAYTFANLSEDIDSYTCTIALFDSPGSIISTHILTPSSTVSDLFSGLSPLTKYYLTITPAANQFSDTFTYEFTTESIFMCSDPSGSLTTINLSTLQMTVYWLNPAIHAACGYKVLYRKKGGSVYSTLDTSGSTSGSTSINITTTAPASYEGYIKSNCCNDNLSSGDPFGENGYGLIYAVAGIRTSPLNFKVTVTSPYPNPYDTIITGTFVSNQQGTLSYSATYPAGSTSAVIIVGNTPTGNNIEAVSNTTINTITPVFNNGGQLQQYDPVSTPAYFEFFSTSGATSGTTTWNGNPSTLPSFTQDLFSVTETDISSNPLAGDLTVSWAQRNSYRTGLFPYDSMKFTIEQVSDSVVLGSQEFASNIAGLRTVTISMIKGTQAISVSTLYRLRSYWADDSSAGSATFYLPDF